MKSTIHVNRHNIAANKKGADLPVFTVKDYRRNRKGDAVACHGPVFFHYHPDKPLKCGAVAYVVTNSEVDVWQKGKPVR